MIKNRTNRKNFGKPTIKARTFKKEQSVRQPDHVFNLFLLVNNNAEIRRFTALGIIRYLLKNNEITGTKNYVNFMVNKFSVTSDGLAREYFYTEPFFLNALVASFASFSASAQRTIDKFIQMELESTINDTVDSQEVDDIVQNIDTSNSGTVDTVSDSEEEAEPAQ